MFSKIFDSIYDGSLRKDWKALVVFQQLLVLCDWEGYIDMTSDAISSRTAIPLDFIEYGLGELAKCDPNSRSDREDGKRIVLINPKRNWGWRIVNFVEYRNIQNQEQLRSYWRGTKQVARLETKGLERVGELKENLSKMFDRKNGDSWSYLDESMLAEVGRRENSLIEFGELLKMKARSPKYFPRSLSKLLGDWTGYLDRSRAPATEENGAPTHIQLRVVEEQIEGHKANPQSTSYLKNPSPEAKAELAQLGKRREELKRQISGLKP